MSENALTEQVRRIDFAEKTAIDRILPWFEEVSDERDRRKKEPK